MSAINGICRKCDHAMKWLLLGRNASTTNLKLARVTIALKCENDQAAK